MANLIVCGVEFVYSASTGTRWIESVGIVGDDKVAEIQATLVQEMPGYRFFRRVGPDRIEDGGEEVFFALYRLPGLEFYLVGSPRREGGKVQFFLHTAENERRHRATALNRQYQPAAGRMEMIK